MTLQRAPLLLVIVSLVAAAHAQEPGGPPPGGPGFGPPGMGGDRAIVKDADAGHDGRPNAAERKAARAVLAAEKEARMKEGEGGGGFRGPPRERREPAKPGVAVKVGDVTPVSDKTPLYDPSVL